MRLYKTTLKSSIIETTTLIFSLAWLAALSGCAPQPAMDQQTGGNSVPKDAGAISQGDAQAPSHDNRNDSGSGPFEGRDAQTPLEPNATVLCGDADDCLTGEVCVEGVCTVERCPGAYDSAPPLGTLHTFIQDREVVVADQAPSGGSYWVDTYAPDSQGLVYPSSGGSWSTNSAPVSDVAGGDFLGEKPQLVATCRAHRQAVRFLSSSAVYELPLSFAPHSLAAGDLDGDGKDELVALGALDELAVCHVDEARCVTYTLGGGFDLLDVAAANVQGDRRDEVVVLLLWSGNGGDGEAYIMVGELSPQNDELSVAGGYVDAPLYRVAAGDVNGSGHAEILTLSDGGWWGWGDDHLITYAMEDGLSGAPIQLGDVQIDGAEDVVDLCVGDTDADLQSDVFLLRENREVRVLRASSQGGGSGGSGALINYTEILADTLSVSVSPNRIAMADVDGDSPAARLVGGPTLVKGRLVPMVVMGIPPYDAANSQGTPTVWHGSNESSSATLTDTVSLSLSVDVGLTQGMANLFEVSLSQSITARLAQSQSVTQSVLIGSRYSVTADPALTGQRYGSVTLGWGCFHGYTYEIVDPGAKLPALGQPTGGGRFVLVVPVSGGTALWSTQRYNAMATALGGLPQIQIPYEAGEVSSYPSSPRTLEGNPIPTGDLVFPNVSPQMVSDIGSVGWFLSVGETQTNSTTLGVDLSTSGAISMAGFSFGASLGNSWDRGYALTVGSSGLFGATLPPLHDDPDTPADEYAQNLYSVTPVVYRQHYLDPDGADASYYVMTYSVDR